MAQPEKDTNEKIPLWVVGRGAINDGYCWFKLFRKRETAKQEFDRLFRKFKGEDLEESPTRAFAKISYAGYIELFMKTTED